MPSCGSPAPNEESRLLLRRCIIAQIRICSTQKRGLAFIHFVLLCAFYFWVGGEKYARQRSKELKDNKSRTAKLYYFSTI